MATWLSHGCVHFLVDRRFSDSKPTGHSAEKFNYSHRKRFLSTASLLTPSPKHWLSNYSFTILTRRASHFRFLHIMKLLAPTATAKLDIESLPRPRKTKAMLWLIDWTLCLYSPMWYTMINTNVLIPTVTTKVKHIHCEQYFFNVWKLCPTSTGRQFSLACNPYVWPQLN